MKSRILWLNLILVTAVIGGQAQNISLLPLPKNIHIKTMQFRPSGNFVIGVSGPGKDELLVRTVVRLADKIQKKSMSTIYPMLNKNVQTNDSITILIRVEKSEKMHIGIDESYKLNVIGNRMILSADNTIGALRGIETILQLLSLDKLGYYFPEIEILLLLLMLYVSIHP